MLDKLKTLFHSVVSNEHVRRVFHTFWQAAGGVLLAQVLVAHSAKDLYAAVVVAGAAGLAAVKALYLQRQ